MTYVSTIIITSNLEGEALEDSLVEISIQKGEQIQGRLRGEDNGSKAPQIMSCSENYK